MKAFAIEAYNQDPKFIDQTKPQINDKEVLIEVHAASINPLDSKIRKGELKAILDYDMPLVLGNDFSGTVVEKGKTSQNLILETKFTANHVQKRWAHSQNISH